MYPKLKVQNRRVLLMLMLGGIVMFNCPGASGSPVVSVVHTETTKQTNYFTANTVTLSNGKVFEEDIINGPPAPPPGFTVERQAVKLPEPASAAGVNILTVPAFNWVFGCSAVSGAMIAGYYDRNGYPNIYTGPTNGGVMPLNNSSWPTWPDGDATYPSCPLIASRNGVDGRTTRGSIDDYWVQYSSSAQDPYITNGWSQHTRGDAIGDYMKTSQSAFANTDGSTAFYSYGSSSSTPLTCTTMAASSLSDGTLGRKLFYEARGYTVTDCYNQNTDNKVSGGFSFAQFKAEIDAGRPVMLNLAGHTVVGVGYDDSSNLVYIHDTWDYNNHTMTWGGSYSGMPLQSVSIVNLAITVIPPSINSTDPASGAVGVPVSSSIKAVFSKAMNPSTINASTFTLNNGITGSVSYDPATNTATFTPSANLAYNTLYTATVSSDVTDVDGNPMTNSKTWSFTTVVGRHLTLAVDGNGSVNSDPTGIACTSGTSGTSGNCSALYPTGEAVTLTATGVVSTTTLSHFGGWSVGCDSENGSDCSVTMSADKNIAATFITNLPVYIPDVNYYGSLHDAYNGTVATNVTIEAQAVLLPSLDFNLDKSKAVLLKGGYDSAYKGNSGGYTTMDGVLDIQAGSLTVENLIIK
jgi:YD repeat-containing protein